MTNKQGKKENVRTMFNNIAGKYDFLNHFLSAGIDYLWRRRVARIIRRENPKTILDVATGTGDLAIELAKKSKARITGIDIAQGMLDIGQQKLKAKGLENQISLRLADSEKLPFSDNSFDVAMVAFGVRNFEDLDRGLSEMHRVIRLGGMIVVLEFSKPTAFPVKQLYSFYFRFILPRLGKIISQDDSAYTYLPESVGQFPDGKLFLDRLEKAGFIQTRQDRRSFGVATIYVAHKR